MDAQKIKTRIAGLKAKQTAILQQIPQLQSQVLQIQGGILELELLLAEDAKLRAVPAEEPDVEAKPE